MRNILYILFFLALACGCCSNMNKNPRIKILKDSISNLCCAGGNSRKSDTTEDIIVHKTGYSSVSGNKEEIVYFTDGNDTLNFFCIFNKKPQTGELAVLMRFDENISKSFSETDTAVVSDLSYNKSGYRNVSYKQQMHLFYLFMKRLVSDGYQLDISYIDYQMINSGMANVEITNEYNKHNGCKSLSEILSNSCLRYDIDSILAPYHLKVNNTFVADNIYLFHTKEYFLGKNIIENNLSLPDSLLEFYAIMSIEHVS